MCLAWWIHVKRRHFHADTLTVPQSGALILAVEVTPIEDEEDEPSGGIETPPALVLAPGQWYSALLVTDADEGHQPMFLEGGRMDQAPNE